MSAVLEAQEPRASYMAALQPPLVRQFDLLATAPGGVARLRELILTLAVQGKLVPQDPSDEPASVLLQKIRSEKDRLIAKGIFRRERIQDWTPIKYPPFDIPDGWEWVYLGEITNFGSPTKSSNIDQNTWVLDLEDIEKSTGRLIQKIRASERPTLSDKNAFLRNEVLYGKLRPYLNKVLVADEDGVCTTELLPFRCYGDYAPEYFAVALRSPFFLDYVNALSYGMKMPRLGTEDGKMAPFPLPPLTEQSRIVTRVKELMRLCDALESQRQLETAQHAQLLSTLLGTLTDSTSPEELAANWKRVSDHFDLLLDRPEAIDAFERTLQSLAIQGRLVPQDPSEAAIASTDILEFNFPTSQNSSDSEESAEIESPRIDLPMGWIWAQAQQLCRTACTITYGVLKPVWVEIGVPTVRVQDMKDGQISVASVGQCSHDRAEKFSKTRLETGDLLIAKDGATLGKTAFVPPELAGGNITQHVLRFPITHKVDHDYVRLVIDSPHGQTWMRQETKGVALPGVNVGDFRRMPIPLPPRAEQLRIIARVNQLRSLCADLRQRLSARQTTQSHLAEALVEV